MSNALRLERARTESLEKTAADLEESLKRLELDAEKYKSLFLEVRCPDLLISSNPPNNFDGQKSRQLDAHVKDKHVKVTRVIQHLLVEQSTALKKAARDKMHDNNLNLARLTIQRFELRSFSIEAVLLTDRV